MITVAAVVPSQNSDAVTLKIERRMPSAEKPESRLKLAVKDFALRKTGDVNMALGKGFETRLGTAMREQDPVRFRRVENLKMDQGESADNETALRIAREKGFHCIVFGSIEERMNSMNKCVLSSSAPG